MDSQTSTSPAWDDIHNWSLFLPPSRPSRYQLEIIHNHVNKLESGADVAILGSTPEFRNLLARSKVQDIWIFEKNLGFYNAVSELRIQNSPEKLVHGDWRETLRQFEQKFDLILSDSTIGNIPYEDRENFYEHLAGALAKDGRFIDKVLKNDAPPRQLDDLDSEFRLRPYNLKTLNDFANAYFFTSELPYNLRVVDVDEIYTTLAARFEDSKLQRLLTDTVKTLYPTESVWYYGKRWETIKENYYGPLHPVKEIEEPESSPFHRRGGVLISEVQS